jgi:hypothetical protein
LSSRILYLINKNLNRKLAIIEVKMWGKIGEKLKEFGGSIIFHEKIV